MSVRRSKVKVENMAAPSKVFSRFGRPICVILGATGAGKSKLALDMAAKFGGEIISADSMQVYKKLDIVTNKVTQEEREICVHHMIDCISPLTTNYTVVQFRNTTLPIINDIHERKKLPIIVGGTNYYIEALLWNMLIDSEINPQKTTDSPSGESGVNHTDSFLPSGEDEPDLLDSVVPPGESDANHYSALTCYECGSGKDEASNKNECSASGRGQYDKKTTPDLFKILQETDPERAKQVHPHDRRKILRSLEVFEQTGIPMSEHLKKQHGEMEQSGVSGPLRYPNPCVIWVQCEQRVLDQRTDRRVDQMIYEGLLQELKDFHRDYNDTRIQNQQEADYTLGIFQSIGFKEFHEYLVLPEADQDSEEGQLLLKKGIEEMKRATRQYARRQNKWMVNRFLKRRGSEVPLVYGVDSTDASKWQDEVHAPAAQILDSYLKDMPIPHDPLPVQENRNLPEYNYCPICDLVFLTSEQWKIHLRGRRHKKNSEHQRRMEKMNMILPKPANSEISHGDEKPSGEAGLS